MTQTTAERWDIFEVALEGPTEGNPFLDVTFGATFTHGHRAVEVEGFYDGVNDDRSSGIYRVRLMPDEVGEWRYTTRSSAADLDGKTGGFTCTPAEEGNHGPVHVHNTYHWQYADGTPHFSFGTTCYVWNHQGDAMETQTLETLKDAPFTKMRMCTFPKHYTYSHNEPEYHAFEIKDDGTFDLERFNPAFFQHLEQCIAGLRDLNIEADLILFHPYDRWGYAEMPSEVDDRYLHYIVARLAAYRNMWWSMANEFDLMKAKSMEDWDRFFKTVQTLDPYQHPRSNHNCRVFYDHGKPWVTHCSIQRSDLENVNRWRDEYRKPVVVDECQYEGNIPFNWGNISAQEMTHRFWEGFVRGGYVGHGETYVHPDDVLWWSKGGVLHGQSAPRIAFLREVMEAGPQIDPLTTNWNLTESGDDVYRLVYMGRHQPVSKTLRLPEDRQYTIDVIDTWEMTISRLDGTYSGECSVGLPGKPHVALRVRAVE